MSWQNFRKGLDEHPGLAGSVGNGGEGRCWVFKPIVSAEQVAKPFFNIACASEICPRPSVISVAHEDIPALIAILKAVHALNPKSPEAAMDTIIAAREAKQVS